MKRMGKSLAILKNNISITFRLKVPNMPNNVNNAFALMKPTQIFSLDGFLSLGHWLWFMCFSIFLKEMTSVEDWISDFTGASLCSGYLSNLWPTKIFCRRGKKGIALMARGFHLWKVFSRTEAISNFLLLFCDNCLLSADEIWKILANLDPEKVIETMKVFVGKLWEDAVLLRSLHLSGFSVVLMSSWSSVINHRKDFPKEDARTIESGSSLILPCIGSHWLGGKDKHKPASKFFILPLPASQREEDALELNMWSSQWPASKLIKVVASRRDNAVCIDPVSFVRNPNLT